MNAQYPLETIHLKKSFGNFTAVEDANLQVRKGEVFGFLGPNGAGKTTTIGMILGLLHPTAGEVRIFGETVTPSHNKALRKVGSLVGAPALVPYLSGKQNLEIIARLSPQITQAKIQETIQQVGLADAANRPAGKYSTGMKQRLGLAIAMLHSPEILILDEPTNGMDPAGMREVRDLLRGLADQGVTVMLSSHLLHEVEQVCDRVAVINKGKVIAQGAVSELLGNQTHVKVHVDNPTQVAAILAQIPGAVNIQPNGRFVTLAGVTSQNIIAHLAANGIYPNEITSGRPDLESLFLELTQNPS